MIKFNNEAVEVLNNPKFNGVTVGEYIRLRGYSDVSARSTTLSLDTSNTTVIWWLHTEIFTIFGQY